MSARILPPAGVTEASVLIRAQGAQRLCTVQPCDSVGFLRQEYWTPLRWPPVGDLPSPGIEPASPASPALAGGRSPAPTQPSTKRHIVLEKIIHTYFHKLEGALRCFS